MSEERKKSLSDKIDSLINLAKNQIEEEKSADLEQEKKDKQRADYDKWLVDNAGKIAESAQTIWQWHNEFTSSDDFAKIWELSQKKNRHKEIKVGKLICSPLVIFLNININTKQDVDTSHLSFAKVRYASPERNPMERLSQVLEIRVDDKSLVVIEMVSYGKSYTITSVKDLLEKVNPSVILLVAERIKSGKMEEIIEDVISAQI